MTDFTKRDWSMAQLRIASGQLPKTSAELAALRREVLDEEAEEVLGELDETADALRSLLEEHREILELYGITDLLSEVLNDLNKRVEALEAIAYGPSAGEARYGKGNPEQEG